MWYSATTYQKINSSIISKGVMNSFKVMFPLARMFPLAVMHKGFEQFLEIRKYRGVFRSTFIKEIPVKVHLVAFFSEKK